MWGVTIREGDESELAIGVSVLRGSTVVDDDYTDTVVDFEAELQDKDGDDLDSFGGADTAKPLRKWKG